MSKVLGLSFYFHDSAAALIVDGQIVAAATEERFSRRKHTSEFPKMAIEYCLHAGNLQSINELDAIVFYEKPVLKLFRAVESLVVNWPQGFVTFVTKLPRLLSSKVNIYEVIRQYLPGYRGQVLFSEHHLSHAASAFYCSPYQNAAILTVDGVGEWETATIGYGEGQDIRLDYVIHFPHSVGLLYSALTAYLGFKVNDGEWKVMGLSPYGEPTYVDLFRKLVRTRDDGSFELDLKYFAHHYSSKWTANLSQWEKLFGFAKRGPEAPIEQYHENLARSGQAVVEELILNMARQAKKLSGSKNLVIAGGVGLNCVANWRIEVEGIFKNVWVQPAAGDDGGALGAALLVSRYLFHDPPCRPMSHAYLGPSYLDAEIEDFLKTRHIPFVHVDEQSLIQEVADRIGRGEVIGWFRGAMEFGPRALGSRSILASPTTAEMKTTLNQKVKFREYFRPFAPAVPLEHVHEYFEVEPGTDLPFMLKVPRVRPEKRALIPAVTHEDGTGRVQTVTPDDNLVFYQLLEALHQRIGVPVVLNTSFNVRGEPIVCTPQDAYQCFIQTEIDALILGNYIVTQKLAPKINIAAAFKRSDALEATSHDRDDREATTKASVLAIESVTQEVKDRESTGRRVLDFYKELPFNYYSNSIDTAVQLLKHNRIQEYPLLHAYLKKLRHGRVLDVGCGAGWFVNSCAYFYGLNVVGIDVNLVVLKQARAVARLFPPQGQREFIEADLFTYHPLEPFDVVNSLGVLHHTSDCHQAIRQVLEWVKEGGYLHLGLYHEYGRRPFLDYFAKLKAQGVSELELYELFAELNPDITDHVHMKSWFRDQVLHPHETQHTYREIHDLLHSEGFLVEATSINKYRPHLDPGAIEKLERQLEQCAHEALYRKKQYYPGFFTVWAKKVKQASQVTQRNMQFDEMALAYS